MDTSTLTIVAVVTLGFIVLVDVVVIKLYVQRLQSRLKQPTEAHKTEFLSLVSHYFLTPLAIIRGNIAEVMDPASKNLSETDREKLYLNIQVNTNRLLLLIQNVITTSSIDQNTLKVSPNAVSIIELIDNAIADVHAESVQKNLVIKFNRPQLVVDQARIDAEKIRQSLINILSNAVKFTGSGGSVVITLSEVDQMYKIQIADSGIGISPDEVKKLFTRFHRGTSYLNMDYEGVGLGLYIAKYLIEINGGTISVQSAVHKGTEVTVWLKK